jgi:hypothetical protein
MQYKKIHLTMSKSSQNIFLTTDILYTIFNNFKRQDDIYLLLTVHSTWTQVNIFIFFFFYNYRILFSFSKF